MPTSADRFALDESHARFMQMDGISINLASRRPDNRPCVGRALGCLVSEDRTRVTVTVASRQYARVVEAIAASGAIAVVFSQPSTHRTMQLKGSDAVLGALTAEDSARAARGAESFVDVLDRLGYRREVVQAFVGYDPGELRAITFTPAAAFEQTPGPNAGTRLRSP